MEEMLGELLSKDRRKDAEGSSSLDKQLRTTCRQFFNQRIEFHPTVEPDSYLEHLKARYKPLNKVHPGMEEPMDTCEGPSGVVVGPRIPAVGNKTLTDGVPHPKKVLFDPGRLEMKWRQARSIGTGLANMGNSCFLNSVLQSLSYTPPLFNYLVSNDHKQKCRVQGFCAMCELQRHCMRVFNTAGGIIRPVPIVQNLKAIAKHFRQGRQEDAHEFLRYFVDGLQKSCLQGLPSKLDPHSKATTVIHQIFGGYHRSQVKCLSCLRTSDTFDPLLDMSLDIKNCPTLIRALQKSIKPDLLEGENKYACPFCKKLTRAQKRFTVHRLPRVLTIQFKRFDYNSMFGGKINKQVAYAEHLNMRPFMSEPQGPTEWYQLYGVLVHFGFTCHSGHYYCYIKNSNGIWYCMNDSQVTQVSVATALQQEAYLLFYIKDEEYQAPPTQAAEKTQTLKIKPDPNFLGTPVKRPPGIDKTGTPLVKTSHKPTGVVTPHSSTITSATREFSIPLRKASTPTLLKRRDSNGSSTTTPTKPPPQQKVTSAPPLNPIFKSPGFTPRVITTKPKKLHKLPGFSAPVKHVAPTKVEKEDILAMAEEKMESSKSIVPEPPSSREEAEIVIELESSQQQQSKPEAEKVQTILDIAEMTISRAAAPKTLMLSPSKNERDFIGPLLPPCIQSPPPSSTTSFVLKSPTTKSPKVALVAPQPQSTTKPVARVLPSPQVTSPIAKPNLETPTKEVTFEEAKKEKNALKPKKKESGDSLSEDEAKVQKSAREKPRERDEESDSQLASADSTTEPHMNSTAHWTVTESQMKSYGPSLPDEYDSGAHGWTVITTQPEPDSNTSTTVFKKKHKKKKYRKHRESSDYIDENQSDLEAKGYQKKKSSKKKVHDHRDDHSSSSDDETPERSLKSKRKESGSHSEEFQRTKKTREYTSSPDRRPHSTTDDDGSHNRYGSTRNHKKHLRHLSDSYGEERRSERHHHSDRDSSREIHPRKHVHSPERSKKRHYRSPSSSGSDSEHRKQGTHRHRSPRREHFSRRHLHVDSTYRHHHHHYHHTPYHRHFHVYGHRHWSPGERRKRVKYFPRQGRVKHHPEEFRREDRVWDKERPHHRREHWRDYDYRKEQDRPSYKLQREREHRDSRRENTSYESSFDKERLKRKRAASERESSPAPERQEHKRHKSDPADESLCREGEASRRDPVPEIEWDASLKTGGGGGKRDRRTWDGSQCSDTVEQLTSHSHSKLGEIVKSWEGGENTIDSATVEGEGQRRERDSWDVELDRGKEKKVKQYREEDYRSQRNPFQEHQNRRNREKSFHRDHHGRPKHGSYHRYHHSH